MSRTQALVLVAHGSLHDPRSATPVHAHADRIRASGRFDEVGTAFWREEPTLRAVATTVSSDVAYVVPVLTSEGYFADEVFPRELGAGRDDPDRPGPEIRYTEPVGTHPALTDVVRDRVEAARRGPAHAVAVVVVGHGTERNERSSRSTRRHTSRLDARGPYAEVVPAFLDEHPRVDGALSRVSAPEVVVVPLLVADGHHATTDVPAALGHPGVGEAAPIDGRLVHCTGAVGTEPGLAAVAIERAVEAGAEPRTGSPSGGPSRASRAFLDRVDAAGAAIEWGELLVSGTPEGYELRHRSDAGAPAEDVDTLGGLEALRARVRRDDRGQYRPLAGAATLPSGWVLPGLDPETLVRAVDAVYPASVDHWHREQRGDLPVTDLPETVARQSGRLADIEGLDRAAIDAATAAVCGDCVRGRRWSVDSDPAGDEPEQGDDLPCPEACPFFLEAARAFAGSPGDVAAEPDPGVPAAAFGEPGNRYRVRFGRGRARHDAATAVPRSPGGGR